MRPDAARHEHWAALRWVLLVAGVGGRDERDVCAAFGIATHRCVYDAADVWMVDGQTDYSCSCAAASTCLADHGGVCLACGVGAHSTASSSDSSVCAECTADSGSFVGFNWTHLLPSFK